MEKDIIYLALDLETQFNERVQYETQRQHQWPQFEQNIEIQSLRCNIVHCVTLYG